MRVLSIDDSKAVRHMIRQAIEVLGFEFMESAHGKEALDVLETRGSADLILLDWNMPVMDGLVFLKTIKADERFKHIPVTMVTTETERHKVIQAIEMGAKNYVMKPFTQEELVTKIMEALGMGI
jgi:two-component system chemotaxis response regulator CheY